MARIRFMLTALLVIAAFGCAPSASAPASSRSEGPPGGVAASSSPKTLVLTQGREIDAMAKYGRTSPEATHTGSAGLSARNSETLEPVPWLAEELPSLDAGTWRVNPDRTMVTTWRVRPNIRWHDRTPFSTKDLVFGWEVNQDPNVPENNRRPGDRMERLNTPDDRTLVIYWKNRYAQAGALLSTELYALPRHVLEPVIRAADYSQYINHPYWTMEFVHLGPFKVARFEIGSHVEFVAFDDYFLGRPKVDRIIYRIISDPNTTLANVLSNEVDVSLDQALSVEGAIVADREWAARGEGVVVVESWYDRFHSSRPPSEVNDWRAFGVALWPDPAKDRVLDDLNSVIEQPLIDQAMVDFARLFTRDLPHLPLKYNAEITSYRKNVRNVPVRFESGGNTVRTWNVHLWEKD
jgi:ABC-type transport system substrate-binding protein